jgi:hypothetical protein
MALTLVLGSISVLIAATTDSVYAVPGRIEGSVTKVVADMGRPLVEDSRSALSWITSQCSTKVPSLA